MIKPYTNGQIFLSIYKRKYTWNKKLEFDLKTSHSKIDSRTSHVNKTQFSQFFSHLAFLTLFKNAS